MARRAGDADRSRGTHVAALGPVVLVLVFGVTLLVAVLVSERARTSVLSTSVLFLVAGVVVGPVALDVVGGRVSHDVLAPAAEVALFTILFVDGAQLSCRTIARAWRLPGRALLVGLPLTIGAVAVAAHVLIGTRWLTSLLLGAVLSPTDPVMVRSILEHRAVPERLRHLLSVESGLNDGLALPPIMILLAMLGVRDADPWRATMEAGGGVLVGAAVGCIALVERLGWFSIAESYRPILGIAIASTVFGLCKLTHTNELLAAFSAGVTLATVRGELASQTARIGEPLSEALKLGALLVFGTTLTIDLDVRTLLFAIVTLIAARPLALLFAFFGGGLSRKQWAVAAWFGPKGFASLLYGGLLVAAAVPDAVHLFHVVGIVVALSVIAHSSTDSLIARTFKEVP